MNLPRHNYQSSYATNRNVKNGIFRAFSFAVEQFQNRNFYIINE